MAHHHAADAARGVVRHARRLGLQHRLQLGEDGGEGLQDVGVGAGVHLQQADGEGGVGLGVGVLVAEAVEEEFE